MELNAEDIVRIIDWHHGTPIILFTEVPEPDDETIRQSWDLAHKLTENKPFHVIADISNVKPPSAELRAAIKEEYLKLKPQILSTQMYIGENFLLKIALQFFAASMGLKNFSIAKKRGRGPS